MFFYGGCLALVACGLLHDTVFNGKSYLTVFTLNLISIFFQVATTAYQKLTGFTFMPDDPDSFSSLLVFLNGVNMTLTNFFITVLIPLNIAAKNRKSVELSGAGTTMATINLSYWLFGGVAHEMTLAIKELYSGGSDYIGIVVVILLSIVSNVIIWRPAKKEYREFSSSLCKSCRRQPVIEY